MKNMSEDIDMGIWQNIHKPMDIRVQNLSGLVPIYELWGTVETRVERLIFDNLDDWWS